MEFTILLIALCVALALSILFGFYAIKFGIILLKVQDQIEESLDILDNEYQTINEILKIPVYSDNTEVRAIVRNFQNARDSIVLVANIMTRHSSGKEIVEIEED